MTARLMHSSLWLLIRLQVLARMRSLRKLGKTWKGRFILFLLIAGLGFWLIGAFVGSGSAGRFSPDTIRTVGAMLLGGMLVSSVLFGGSEGGIPFSEPEVEFLFPAPIPRRHLLVYRIVLMMLITLPTSLFIGFTFQRNTPTFLGAWLGGWFSLSLISLSQIARQLIVGIVERATVARSKKGMLGLLVVVLVAAMATGAFGTRLSTSTLVSFGSSQVGRIVLSPFVPFTSVLAASSLSEILMNSAICLTMLVGLVALILRLDANHTEASLGASQRMAKQLAAARSGRLAFNQGNAFLERYSMPQLPRLGGAGAIGWYQLTSLLRSAGHLALFLIIIGGVMMAPILMSDTIVIRQVLAVMVAMSVFMLPQFIQYDFRSDIDRMPVLKALPLNPLAIVCGELIAPVLVTVAVQLLMIAIILAIGGAEQKVVVLIAAFLVPVDVLIYMVENFVFLLFPFRVGPNNGQDLQNVIRVMLTMLLKMLLIGVFCGVAAGLGGLTYYLTHSEAFAYATGWLCTLACCAGLLPAMSWAFRKFDPATDTPG